MKKYVWLVIVVFVIGIGILLYKGTYSMEEEDISVKLVLKYDSDNLENKIYDYIDMIDDEIIPMSSFVMSDVLSDNYDFLTVFAIDFILKHIDYYSDKITILDDYTYDDGYMTYTTSKYVSKDVIYKITDDVFNKKDYLIINDYLKVNNDMVPLLIINDDSFGMEIDRIVSTVESGNNYIVKVKYKDMDLVYKYVFQKVDDRLVLKNLEV